MKPTYPVTLTVEKQLLMDLLVTAVEGGSHYWAEFRSIERNSDLSIHKVTVIDTGGFTSKTYLVTPELMASGLQRLGDVLGNDEKRAKFKTAGKHLIDALTEEGDATTADVVLQMALFNDVIYG